jgi:hypothetical protein
MPLLVAHRALLHTPSDRVASDVFFFVHALRTFSAFSPLFLDGAQCGGVQSHWATRVFRFRVLRLSCTLYIAFVAMRIFTRVPRAPARQSLLDRAC